MKMATRSNVNPKTVIALRKCDPKLATLMRRVGGHQFESRRTHHSPYQSLIRSVIYQQLHGKAAASILQRLMDFFPQKDFPTAEQLQATSLEQLRELGVSRSKGLALLDIAAKSSAGLIPTMAQAQKMNDEEIIEALTKIRGVGRWTVEMFLIFRLGRPDVLPLGDFAIRKAYMLMMKKKKMPTPKELERYGQRWAPYRSTASLYLWRSLDPEVLAVNPTSDRKAKPMTKPKTKEKSKPKSKPKSNSKS